MEMGAVLFTKNGEGRTLILTSSFNLSKVLCQYSDHAG